MACFAQAVITKILNVKNNIVTMIIQQAEYYYCDDQK